MTENSYSEQDAEDLRRLAQADGDEAMSEKAGREEVVWNLQIAQAMTGVTVNNAHAARDEALAKRDEALANLVNMLAAVVAVGGFAAIIVAVVQAFRS